MERTETKDRFLIPKLRFGRTIGRTVGQLTAARLIEYNRNRAERFNLSVSGLENLENLKNRSYILVANHLKPEGFVAQQTGNPPDATIIEKIVFQTTGRRLRIVAQEDSNKWWFKNAALRRGQRALEQVRAGFMEKTDLIPIKKNPGSINLAFFREFGKAIVNNDLVLIFPEGDWYEDFSTENPLQLGTARLAKKYNLPIVPAYIHGATSWKPHTKVDVAFGEPINPDGKTREEVTEQIRQSITALQKTR